MEEDRTPVGRLDFKSSEGRTTPLVGSTPTLFRQMFIWNITIIKFNKQFRLTNLCARLVFYSSTLMVAGWCDLTTCPTTEPFATTFP